MAEAPRHLVEDCLRAGQAMHVFGRVPRRRGYRGRSTCGGASYGGRFSDAPAVADTVGSLYVPPGAARDAWGLSAMSRTDLRGGSGTRRCGIRCAAWCCRTRAAQATTVARQERRCRGFAGSLDGRTVMADDRDRRADAEIARDSKPRRNRRRPRCASWPDAAGRNGFGPAPKRHYAKLHVIARCERAAGFARLTRRRSSGMRDVSRELANYTPPRRTARLAERRSPRSFCFGKVGRF